MKKFAGAAVVVALAAMLVSCGDDDTDTARDDTIPAASISKDDYIAQANAICEAGQTEIAEALAQVTAGTSEEEVAAIVVESIRAQVDELRGLGYPEGDQETLEGIFSDADTVLDQIEADPSSVMGTENPFTGVNEQFANYGLTACAD